MIAPQPGANGRPSTRRDGKEGSLVTSTNSASTEPAPPTQQDDSFWWQGGLYRMKARSAGTGGALGVVEATLGRDFGPPLHVHHREDESFYLLEGEVRFRQGDQEFVAGPGTWVWGERGVPHTFKVESDRARLLIIVTPGGFEEMFEAGGVPVAQSPEPPVQEYDPADAIAMAQRYQFDVVGPQLP